MRQSLLTFAAIYAVVAPLVARSTTRDLLELFHRTRCARGGVTAAALADDRS